MQASGHDDFPSSPNDWWPPDYDDDDWGAFPPPPPPPSTGPSQCSGDLYCHIGAEGGPMGAHFDRASFPSLPIVAVCSSVVLVAVLVASFLFWRHKSKVQNLLPSKTEQQGRLEGMGAANGVTYEDILAGHHPTRLTQGHLAGSQTLMPLEILDVKLGDMGPPHIMAMHHAPCYPPTRDPSHLVGSKPFHHPVYEEVSQAPTGNNRPATTGRSLTSDEDLAEEEGGSGQCSATSSVRGSTGGDLCRDPVSSDGEDCVEPYPVNNSYGFNHKGQQQTYPEQRTRNFRSSHSTKPNNGGPLNRPSYVPPSTFGPRPVDPRSTAQQWMASQCYNQDNNFPSPAVSASQENIYSTIDEDEEYPVNPPLTSLAHGQRGSPMGKGANAHGLARPPLSQQRKPDENGGSSYGDIMPAFHSASFM